MAYHLDHAQFERARWRKALLVPAWFLQLVLLMGLVGIFSYRLAKTVKDWQDSEDKGNTPTVDLV